MICFRISSMKQLLKSKFILFLIYQMVPWYIMAIEKVTMFHKHGSVGKCFQNDLNKQNPQRSESKIYAANRI